MIPPQEYILLENVEGYTVDHLVNAILEGHIDAYFEWPKAKQHVPMSFKGKLSQYVRIIQPVFKDGDDKLIFSKVAVLSSEGDIVSEPSLRVPHALIDDIRIKAKDLAAGQPVDSLPERPTLDDFVKCNRGKMSEEQIVYELRELGYTNNEIGVALGGTYRKGNNALSVSIGRKYKAYKEKMLGQSEP